MRRGRLLISVRGATSRRRRRATGRSSTSVRLLISCRTRHTQSIKFCRRRNALLATGKRRGRKEMRGIAEAR